MDQVRAAYTERLKSGAVHSTLDPLMHGLSGNGRFNVPPRFLHTIVFAHRIIAGPPFRTRAADAETRQRISEVHDCQL